MVTIKEWMDFGQFQNRKQQLTCVMGPVLMQLCFLVAQKPIVTSELLRVFFEPIHIELVGLP